MNLLKFLDPLSIASFLRQVSILRSIKKRGRNFIFDPLSTILTPESVEVGDDVFIGERAHISAKLTIGNNVMFGPRPIIVGGNHLFGIVGKSVRFLQPVDGENIEPILVEDEAWCGAHVILLGGVTLGIGCVVGAGSVVSRNIPPFVIAVGNPCRPIARIFDDKTLMKHVTTLGYSQATSAEIVKRRADGLRKIGRAHV